MLAFLAAAPLAITPAGAGQLSDRAKEMGSKVKCMCGSCDMSAAGCSHPGGAFSGPCDTAKAMLVEIEQRVSKGESDDQILQAFVQTYGTRVYAEPPKSGFSLVAWAMPSVYLVLGTVLVIFVISRWRKRPAQAAAPASTVPGISEELLQRAREQAARETQD